MNIMFYKAGIEDYYVFNELASHYERKLIRTNSNKYAKGDLTFDEMEFYDHIANAEKETYIFTEGEGAIGYVTIIFIGKIAVLREFFVLPSLFDKAAKPMLDIIKELVRHQNIHNIRTRVDFGSARERKFFLKNGFEIKCIDIGDNDFYLVYNM